MLIQFQSSVVFRDADSLGHPEGQALGLLRPHPDARLRVPGRRQQGGLDRLDFLVTLKIKERKKKILLLPSFVSLGLLQKGEHSATEY